MIASNLVIQTIDGERARLLPVDLTAAQSLLPMDRDRAGDEVLPWAQL